MFVSTLPSATKKKKKKIKLDYMRIGATLDFKSTLITIQLLDLAV